MRALSTLVGTFVALCACATAAAAAAPWPERPVTIVVSDPPGSGQDTVARLVAEGVARHLGQPVVVENKPGASGMIASSQVLRAPADGYTALFAVTGLIINPLLFPSQANYDPLNDFVPVANTVLSPIVLVTNSEVPARTLKEFVELARGKPGAYSYGSIGNGSVTHIYGELFASGHGIDLMHVPYQGGAPALQALLGNQIQATFLTYGSVRAHVASGRLRALAVTGEERMGSNRDIPTFVESNFPDFRYSGWMGIFMPAGVPEDRAATFAQAVHKAVHEPRIADKLLAMGMIPDGADGSKLRVALERDQKRWREWIPRFGIKAQ